MSNVLAPSTARTPAGHLRQGLTEAERLVSNLRGAGPEEGPER